MPTCWQASCTCAGYRSDRKPAHFAQVLTARLSASSRTSPCRGRRLMRQARRLCTLKAIPGIRRCMPGVYVRSWRLFNREDSMPMPKPKPDESQNDFIDRCMGDDIMNEDSLWSLRYVQIHGTTCPCALYKARTYESVFSVPSAISYQLPASCRIYFYLLKTDC